MNRFTAFVTSFFTPFWEKQPIRLALTGTPDECLGLIRKHTTAIPLDLRNHKLFRGIVARDRMWVTHNMSIANNYLPPTLSARIITDNDRTLLVGFFGMSFITKIFFFIWWSCLASLALTAMPILLQEAIFLLIFLALLIAPFLVIRLGMHFTKGQDETMRKNLINIFSAKDITSY